MAELFEKVEINRESIWPRMSRILAGSIALHLIMAAVVVYVPGLRDALYIASLYGGASYVSGDYKRTVIGERATIIDLANDRFQYPEGYFAIANGEAMPAVSTIAPAPQVPDVQIISQAQPEPRPPKIRTPWTKPPRPLGSPTPIAAASPSPSPQASPTAAVASASPTPSPGPNSDADAQKQTEQAAAQAGIGLFPQINTKPFTDLYDQVKQMQERGEINLSGVIAVSVEADINEDGTFSNPQVTAQSGDAKLVDLATKAVASLSDSGVLKPMNELKHITLKLVANDTDVLVTVTSDAASADRAKSLSNALSIMLNAAAYKKKGRDEEAFFKSTNITSNGNQIVVNFKMPRSDFGAKIAKLSKKQTS